MPSARIARTISSTGSVDGYAVGPPASIAVPEPAVVSLSVVVASSRLCANRSTEMPGRPSAWPKQMTTSGSAAPMAARSSTAARVGDRQHGLRDVAVQSLDELLRRIDRRAAERLEAGDEHAGQGFSSSRPTAASAALGCGYSTTRVTCPSFIVTIAA